MDTHRVPLGVNFSHPSGFSAFLTGTYWDQSGTFQRLSTLTYQSGRDDFWVVDAAIRYRLPQRYGFVTVGATNLFDQKFKYFNTDFNNPGSLQPTRTVFAQFTLAIP